MSQSERFAEAYIAIGSNIDPERHVLEAGKALNDAVEILDVSTLYRSEAKGPRAQAPFVNGVFKVLSHASPMALKYDWLRKIEADLGRVRFADKFAPRTVDLDLVVFGNQVVKTDSLVLPDPDIYRYNHIAVPLLEVGPQLILPDGNRAVSTLESARCREGLEPLFTLTSQLKGIIENGRKAGQ